MKQLFKQSKKFLVSVFVLAIVITLNLGLMLTSKTENVYADQFYVEDSISISNKTFTNYDSSNGYPYKPSSFTFSADNVNAKHGVINISESTFKSNYEKYDLGQNDNPLKVDDDDDNYILMINSRDAFESCGYTSGEFTFGKNGHYYVSVYVNTDDVDGATSLYLMNNDEVLSSITNINTRGEWKNYYFFVSTNEYEDLTLNLGLWLGSREGNKSNACVFFDKISAGEISKSTIKNSIGNGIDGKDTFYNSSKNMCYKNLADENVLNFVEVSDASFKISDDENEGLESTEYYFNNELIDEILYSTLYINNETASYVKFETRDAYLFESNKVYKVSMKVKANLSSGNAYMQLVEDVDDDAKTSDKITISTTTNKFLDGYVEYSFVVNSDAKYDRNFKLVVGLGSQDSTAQGEVYFADMKISSVPYSEYSDADSNQKKYDLSADYDKSKTIENFAFDSSEATEISMSGEVKVTTPNHWTITKSSTTYEQVGGVFNIKDYHKLNKSNLSNMYNPGFIATINTETNNVLMLHNEMQDYLYATSDTFTLSKSTNYVLSVWVNARANTSGANIGLYYDDVIVAKIDNINTNGDWKEYKLCVKTGYDDIQVSLRLGLGTDTIGDNGYAFFDNCMITEGEYVAGIENQYDLTNIFEYSNNDGTPTYFDMTLGDSASIVTNKIVNLNEDIDYDFGALDREGIKAYAGENQKVMYINATTGDVYCKLDSKLKYSLKSGSYYKICVDVYTGGLTNTKSGAGVSLTGIVDSEFKNISTDREWRTYTFLISPDSDVTTQISLLLGNEDESVGGLVVFAGLTFEEIASKDDYTLLINTADEYTKTVGEVEKDEEENEEETEKSEINWVLLTSTFTAIAVIIAVIGVAFKKLVKPGKKHAKNKRVEYDRETTVIQQKYRKLAYLKRDKDIRALEKKAVALKEDRASKEEKYKELLKKIREVKLHNRDGKLNGEIANLNKELNHASRSVSSAGVSLNRIDSEIAFMKTEGYLQNLEKKLRRQDEVAKKNGSSIEEILKNDDIDVSLAEDNGLDDAIKKADELIESKKEEARLEQERLEQERLEQERLEKEQLEKVRLEQEKLVQEQTESNSETVEESQSVQENSELADENQEQTSEQSVPINETENSNPAGENKNSEQSSLDEGDNA